MKNNYSFFNLTKYKLKKYTIPNKFRFNSPLKSNLEQFNKNIKKNMSYYNISQSADDKNMNQTKYFLNKSKIKFNPDETHLINQIRYKNNSTRNKINNRDETNDNNDKVINLTISTPKEFNIYLNPIHSLSVLKVNNKVRSNILNLNIKRQEYLFNKTINDFANSKKNHMNGLSNIKITLSANNLLTKKQNNFTRMTPLRQNSLRNIFKLGNNKTNFFHLYTRLNATFEHCSKNCPQSREQFTFVSNGENFIYLIGGICCVNECNEIWKYDICSSSWEKIKSKNMTKCRYGHTAIINKTSSRIYIFGGVSKLDIYKNNITKGGEENYGNFEFFDMNKKEWIIPLKTKFHPNFRRNHSCELIGNDLVIMLGIDKENEVLNDVHVLNISFPHQENERWEEVHIAKDSIGPKLYGHTSALVLDEENINLKKIGIYNLPNSYNFINNKNKIKNIGIYVFGGKNKFTGGNISNDIYLFHIGKNPCWWEKIENTKGIKPLPRYFHSMNYYKPGNFLIIHGGKNINSLNDTFLFDLSLYQWNKIIITGIDDNLILPRNGHQSVICANQLFIFGGTNNGNYIGSNMFVINLIPNVLNMLLVNVISNNYNFDGNKDNKTGINNNNKKEEKKRKIIFPKLLLKK